LAKVIALQLFIETIAEPIVPQAETGMCRIENTPESTRPAVMKRYTILSPFLDL
jgi:hypothetical protein